MGGWDQENGFDGFEEVPLGTPAAKEPASSGSKPRGGADEAASLRQEVAGLRARLKAAEAVSRTSKQKQYENRTAPYHGACRQLVGWRCHQILLDDIPGHEQSTAVCHSMIQAPVLGSQAAADSAAEAGGVQEALRGAQQLARDADARAAAVSQRVLCLLSTGNLPATGLCRCPCR
jgi:hypothetical protein